MISSVASNLFASSLYPATVNNNLKNNAVNVVAKAFNVNQGDIKVDYRATDKDAIS